MNEIVKKNLNFAMKQLNDISGYEDLREEAKKIYEQSRAFSKDADLAVALTTKGMEERHWKQLEQWIDEDAKTNGVLTLESIKKGKDQLDVELIDKAKKISDQAAREFQIKQKLDMLNNNWSTIEFTLEPHKRL